MNEGKTWTGAFILVPTAKVRQSKAGLELAVLIILRISRAEGLSLVIWYLALE